MSQTNCLLREREKRFTSFAQPTSLMGSVTEQSACSFVNDRCRDDKVEAMYLISHLHGTV